VVVGRSIHKSLRKGQGTSESLNAALNIHSWCGRTFSGRSLRPHDELDIAKLLFRTVPLAPLYSVNKLYPNCIFAICWSLNSGSGILHVPLRCSPLPPLVPALRNQTIFWELRALSGFFANSFNCDATNQFQHHKTIFQTAV